MHRRVATATGGFTSPRVLNSGNCERMKAGVHGVALATAAVCGGYNIGAWLIRRERHLAVNALIYSAATIWEIAHVRHHLAARPAPQAAALSVYDELEGAA
jgi:hypothetical protein